MILLDNQHISTGIQMEYQIDTNNRKDYPKLKSTNFMTEQTHEKGK